MDWMRGAGDYISTFLRVKLREGKTEQTLESYRKTLTRWQHSGLSPEGFIESLTCNQITRCKYLAELRAFTNWVADTQHLKERPFLGWSMQKPKYLPRRAEATDVREMLRAANERDRLMLMLAADAGLRRMEIARLRIESVNLAERTILAHGKRDKERVTKFGPDTCRVLRVWISQRLADGAHREDPLFPGPDGKRLSVHSISSLFHRLSYRALGRARGPHSFRHFAGSKLLEKTGNLELVRDFLGHETLSTTLLYVKMLGVPLRKHYRSPLEDEL